MSEANETAVVKPAKVKKARVDAATFIRAAFESHSYAEIARKTGLSVKTVGTKLNQFRKKHKIEMPNYPTGGGARVDWDSIGELARSLKSGEASE